MFILGRPHPHAGAPFFAAGSRLKQWAGGPILRLRHGDAMTEPIGHAGRKGMEGMKRTLRHLMITAAIVGVAAALAFLVLADVVCLGDLCH